MSKEGSRSTNMVEKIVEQYARRMVQNLDLTDCSHESCYTLFCLWLLCINDVLRLEIQVFQAEVGRMAASMRGFTWMHVVSVLKNLDEVLMNSENEFDLSYRDFKHLVARKCICSGGGKLSLPSALLSLMYSGIKDHDPLCFKGAHQILSFPCRPDVLNNDARKRLEDELEDKFKATESNIGSFDYPDPDDWFDRYLADYKPFESFVPKLSNGAALCGPRSSSFWHDKWKALEVGFDSVEYLEWQIGYNLTLSQSDTDIQQSARFFSVPKDSSRLRGITIEPALRAYVQQGFLRSLREYVRNHPYLSRRICMERPELSQKLARIGSKSGYFSTIDLSDASDSINWNFLKSHVRNIPLLEALELARTPNITFRDGCTTSLEKFGGMGNALTFVIECLYFCMIVEQGIRDAGGSVSNSRYRVYGDDIVVESKYYTSVCDALARNGSTVNQSKSFSPQVSSFREACGGEYYHGIDVKPIRLPRGIMPTMRDCYQRNADRITCFIDIANSCFGVLPSVRLYIIHELFRVLPVNLRPVFTLDGSSGLRSDTPTNFHLKRVDVRPNTELASWQYDTAIRYGAITPRRKRLKLPEYAQFEYKLLQLKARHTDVDRRWDPLDHISVDLSARQDGTVWKSIVGPDYFSRNDDLTVVMPTL